MAAASGAGNGKKLRRKESRTRVAAKAAAGILDEIIQESLVTERVAAEARRALIACLQGDDPATRRIMQRILEIEDRGIE